MGGLSSSELLLYGGFILMGAAVLLSLFSVVIFKISKKKLNSLLKQEYGDVQQYKRRRGREE